MRRTGESRASNELDELATQMESMNVKDMTDLLQKFATLAVEKLKQD